MSSKSKEVQAKNTFPVNYPTKEIITQPLPNLNTFSNFEEFKDMVELWDAFTYQPKNKRGLLLAYSLPYKSKMYGNKLNILCKREVGIENMAKENGLKFVMDWLEKKINQRVSVYIVYEALNTPRCPDQDIEDYILDFEYCCNRLNLEAAPYRQALTLLDGVKLPDALHESVLEEFFKTKDMELKYVTVRAKILDIANSIRCSKDIIDSKH